MRIFWSRFLWISLAALGGCASEPFTREPLPPLKDPNPRALVTQFVQQLPDRKVTFDETVIIQPPFHDDIAVLGELVVDRAQDSFQLVGLSHVGVTLFQLKGDRNGSTVDFAVPGLSDHRDLLLAVAEDIRRMYFDLAPGDLSKPDIEKTLITFKQTSKEGDLVLKFGGDPLTLLEKEHPGTFGPIWRVRYYQYKPANGSLYPFGIVMDNSKYHYRIIVKNRAMQ